MKKTIIVLMSLAVTLFAGTSYADQEILAKLTVCPQNTQFLKSTTVTLTELNIRFEQVAGEGAISLGEPAQSTFDYEVLYTKSVGLFKKGLEVHYQSADSAGPIVKKILIYNDSLVQLGNKAYAKDCK